MKHLPILALLAFLLSHPSRAQDSLARYSPQQLDSLYTATSQPAQRLVYTLARIERARQTGNDQDTSYARLLTIAGDCHQQLRDLKSAVLLLEQAAAIWQAQAPTALSYTDCLNSLGIVYSQQVQYQQAETVWLKALALRKEKLGEQSIPYAKTLGNLGILYKNSGNYPKAEQHYRQALNIFKTRLGEQHPEYLRTLDGLGSIHLRRGNYVEAKRCYQQALELRKTVLNQQHPAYINSLQLLADAYLYMGDYVQAENYYLQTIQSRKEVLGEQHPDYAQSLHNIGLLYVDIGDYAQAESYYLQALRIRQEVWGTEHPEYAISLNNLGILYYKMKEFDRAETHFVQALAIWKKTLGETHPHYATCLNSLSVLYDEKGDLEQAEAYCLESLRIKRQTLGENHPDYAYSLHNLGYLYYNAYKFDLAETYYLQSLNIKKASLGELHPDYASSLYNLGILYDVTGKYSLSQSYFSQLIRLHIEFLYRTGIALGEKSKQDLFRTMSSHLHYVHRFAAFHRTNDSLLVGIQNGLLLSKGYALTGVSELLPLIKNQADTTLYQQYTDWIEQKSLLGKLYQLPLEERPNTDSLERQTARLEADLMRASAALKERLGYDKKRFSFQDLTAALNKKEVAIDFVRFENEQRDTAWYYALVTQQGWDFPQYVPLCLEKDLEPFAMAEIRMDNEHYIRKKEDNRQVYNLLIKPLEPYLNKQKIVHLAPVGHINQLAIATLQNAKNQSLGERFEIHLYGSLKDFILKKQTNGSTGSIEKSVLLVGDVAFDLEESEHKHLAQNSTEMELYASRSVDSDSTRGTSRFSRLLGTKVEIENLNRAFSSKQWTIQQLQQKDALEENVREYTGDKTPSVLHFATHGFFIPAKKQGADNPLLRSGIALAGANRVWMGKAQIEGVEDGLWTAYEIANLDLHRAELVVLSACETARGQIDQNEGVLGLQRAFKIAGVDNMLLSLWQVPDKETVELMQAFYNYYLNDETPSVALRKAQADMRKRYPDPYFWAAFILIE